MAKTDDKDRAELAAALSTLDDRDLKGIQDALTNLRDSLEDANSAFPETKRFLASRGLTHVRELDKQGLKDLEAHLRATLATITN